jgi:Holliday junction resolvasome RuvABC endonuclease subunit
MGIDDATNVGWALYDTDKPPSAIVSGRFHLDGDTPFDKLLELTAILPKLLREHRPDFIAIEAPKMQTTKFAKKGKADLLGEAAPAQAFASDDRTTSMLNQIHGGVVVICRGMKIPCCVVAPRTWQTILKGHVGADAKQRVSLFLNSLKVVSPNVDARDACGIAIWAAGHSQQLKFETRGRDHA